MHRVESKKQRRQHPNARREQLPRQEVDRRKRGERSENRKTANGYLVVAEADPGAQEEMVEGHVHLLVPNEVQELVALKVRRVEADSLVDPNAPGPKRPGVQDCREKDDQRERRHAPRPPTEPDRRLTAHAEPPG